MAHKQAMRKIITLSSKYKNFTSNLIGNVNWVMGRKSALPLLTPCTSSSHHQSVRLFQVNRKNITEKELSFDESFQPLVQCITEDLDNRNLPEVSGWLEKVLQYNVPHGKKNRGVALVKTFELVAPEWYQDRKHLALLLGWCTEMLQAFFLIMDDIMDHSVTRRGRPCWYKNEGVGLMGINDAILLESSIFVVLKKYFSHLPCYLDLLETFHEFTWLTASGQCLDMMSTPSDARLDLEKFTEKRYNDIILYKTAYYTISLPVKLAVILAGKKDSFSSEVENILSRIGYYFQVQDDYLDCFGDPKITGKQGTDIEDGKCAWPIVMALPRLSTEEKQILHENYGIKDEKSSCLVKAVYFKLGIPEMYLAYEKEIYSVLCNDIEKLPKECKIPKMVFYGLLNQIYKRSK